LSEQRVHMGQFSVTFSYLTGSDLSDIQQDEACSTYSDAYFEYDS